MVETGVDHAAPNIRRYNPKVQSLTLWLMRYSGCGHPRLARSLGLAHASHPQSQGLRSLRGPVDVCSETGSQSVPPQKPVALRRAKTASVRTGDSTVHSFWGNQHLASEVSYVSNLSHSAEQEERFQSESSCYPHLHLYLFSTLIALSVIHLLCSSFFPVGMSSRSLPYVLSVPPSTHGVLLRKTMSMASSMRLSSSTPSSVRHPGFPVHQLIHKGKPNFSHPGFETRLRLWLRFVDVVNHRNSVAFCNRIACLTGRSSLLRHGA